MWKYLLLILCASCTLEKYNDPIPGQCKIKIDFTTSKPFILYQPAKSISTGHIWLGVYSTREEAVRDGFKLGCTSISTGATEPLNLDDLKIK